MRGAWKSLPRGQRQLMVAVTVLLIASAAVCAYMLHELDSLRHSSRLHAALRRHRLQAFEQVRFIALKTRESFHRARGAIHQVLGMEEAAASADERESDGQETVTGCERGSGEKFILLEETDFAGNDLSTHFLKSSDFTDCCLQCAQHPQCKAWTYVASEQACWLKSKVGDHASNGLTVSGALESLHVVTLESAREFKSLLHTVEAELVAAAEGGNDDPGPLLIWPLAQHVDQEGPARPVSSSFSVEQQAGGEEISPDIIAAFVKRVVPATGHSPVAKGVELTGLRVHCGGAWVAASRSDSSYRISLLPQARVATIESPSARGCGRALETFSAICFGGLCNASMFVVEDQPQLEYRGLMLDTGRRFVPVWSIKIILELMSVLHMNVLHLHLTDWAAVRWESRVAPELAGGATGEPHRLYSAQDISSLAKFAAARGIDLVPELDAPGHATSFRSLNSSRVAFCDPQKRIQLHNDPDGRTQHTLQSLVQELIAVFPSSKYIHVGGDETSESGACRSADARALQSELQKTVSAAGRTPIVWNEVDTVLHSAAEKTVVQCWNNCQAGEIANRGLRVIQSEMHSFYLDYTSQACTLRSSFSGGCLWVDPKASFSNFPDANPELLLGGTAPMWTDEFCPQTECIGHGPGWGGHAGWMYAAEQDEVFTLTLLSVIFPRLSLVAGALWRYRASIDQKDLLRLYAAQSWRLERRAQEAAAIHRPQLLTNLHAAKLNGREEGRLSGDVGFSSLICPAFCSGGCTMVSRCGRVLHPL